MEKTDINFDNLITSACEFAKENIKDLPYHNVKHTERVVQAVREIGENEGLDERNIQLLEIAAWFHDTGYTQASCSNHEENSSKISKQFLDGKLTDEDIQTIQECIMATQLPQTPRNLMEQIICDADLAHLGTEDFNTFSEALRKEKSEIVESGNISKSQWLMMNARFMTDHRYFTNYARTHYGPRKREYLQSILKEAETIIEEVEPKQQKEKKKKKKKEKKDPPGEVEILNGVPKLVKPRRDIEEMYSTLAKNQLGLSSIADRKASTLLSINSIITSFAIGYLFRKIEELPELLWPSLILAITGLVSAILAVLATRPNVKKHIKKDKKDLNLLFFGDFVDLELKEYQQLLRETTQYPEEVYDKLSKDAYYLGKVLDLKYKKVRNAFNFFMIGITISVISFIITFSVY
ncbi:Pycsar system effector family protein [Flammeovirga aprica]|uniref:HD domain-containing protein n=1 Tax=Flammeovirga aprica JL-4 TaxID=694437 RepID=A0A7X9RVS6_9BACT|nr:Pycsar system effector family protein [Flammeovirga aprica]NME69633.1 HD domain-containing protein [Flammeovirga aprica JL-4]